MFYTAQLIQACLQSEIALKKHPFSHMMMGQYWLGKISPNKVSAQPKMLSNACYKILNKNIH